MRYLSKLAATRAWTMTAALKRLLRVCDLVGHLPRHKRMVEAVSAAPFEAIRARQPQLTIKYLHDKHLVRGLSSADRAAAMIHHYTVLERRLDRSVLGAILGDGMPLWDHDSVAGRHEVTLRFSHPTDNEGELTFEYSVAGKLIYILSFTFVPGGLVGVAAQTVLLVTRLQGAQNVFADVRDAMKAIHNLAPSALLMASAQGVAEALGVVHIVGVPAARQVSNVAREPHFTTVYDDYFNTLRATKVGGFYAMSLPLYEKPMADIKSSNRARTRHQRDLKSSIARAAARRFGAATFL